MALRDLVAEEEERRNGGCFSGWKRMLSLSLCIIIHGHILLPVFSGLNFLSNIYGR